SANKLKSLWLQIVNVSESPFFTVTLLVTIVSTCFPFLSYRQIEISGTVVTAGRFILPEDGPSST
ncbi:hypothetical protein, partial [Vibrio anguillarum]|uniref:hypothetical protein n=1 Tax=Vibrio anguillarum TaxID=55601 RepID=UPI001BE3F54F